MKSCCRCVPTARTENERRDKSEWLEEQNQVLKAMYIELKSAYQALKSEVSEQRLMCTKKARARRV